MYPVAAFAPTISPEAYQRHSLKKGDLTRLVQIGSGRLTGDNLFPYEVT